MKNFARLLLACALIIMLAACGNDGCIIQSAARVNEEQADDIRNVFESLGIEIDTFEYHRAGGAEFFIVGDADGGIYILALSQDDRSVEAIMDTRSNAVILHADEDGGFVRLVFYEDFPDVPDLASVVSNARLGRIGVVGDLTARFYYFEGMIDLEENVDEFISILIDIREIYGWALETAGFEFFPARSSDLIYLFENVNLNITVMIEVHPELDYPIGIGIMAAP